MAPTLTQKLMGGLKGHPALLVVALVEGEIVVVFAIAVVMLFVVEVVHMEVFVLVVTADVM